MATRGVDDQARGSRVVGFTWGTALLVVAAVVGAFALRDAFVAAHRTAGWVLACSIVALLVEPVVSLLQRRLPRWASVVAVVVGAIGAVVGVTVALVNELLQSLADLEEEAPRAARRLEQRFDWAADVEVADRVANFVAQLHDSVREVTVRRAVGTVPTYLVTGILMLFLLAYGRRYVNGFLDQFDSVERRHRWRAVGTRAVRRGRTYLLLTIAHAVANGLAFWLLCRLLDLPAPLSLGVAVGALTPVPLVGVIVGGIPALLLAAAQPARVAVAVAAAIVVLQSVEALVVRRLVDTRTLRVGPTVPIVAGLLGYELYGVGGAVYAIASAVFALAALDAVGWAQGDDPHPENLKESGIGFDDLPAS